MSAEQRYLLAAKRAKREKFIYTSTVATIQRGSLRIARGGPPSAARGNGGHLQALEVDGPSAKHERRGEGAARCNCY